MRLVLISLVILGGCSRSPAPETKAPDALRAMVRGGRLYSTNFETWAMTDAGLDYSWRNQTSSGHHLLAPTSAQWERLYAAAIKVDPKNPVTSEDTPKFEVKLTLNGQDKPVNYAALFEQLRRIDAELDGGVELEPPAPPITIPKPTFQP